ncbi:HDL038Wp [Eremothecium sinecaudum]|uniref:Conserved oligomeric Golgi complex subunit 2 n=1 Tax=Eremothecium sinecaudum TaxID=45286 RepID=A0A0X8HSM0_9SACH|nr:HDL038Wp [Eremothecium sinecaudum]AMD20706.1 HDL038Wp [Eremothecium sinecaudum]
MDNTFNELELPIIQEVTRDLFTDLVLDPSKEFDVSEFLLQNNFQYVSLDDLSKQMKRLKSDINAALVDEVSNSYTEHLSLCDSFSAEDQSLVLSNAQQAQQDISRFQFKLKQLLENDIQTTSETITDTLEYLKSLDSLQLCLQKHTTLHEHFQIARKLCTALEGLSSDISSTSDHLGGELLREAHNHLNSAYEVLQDIQGTKSPLVARFWNEYHSLLNQFHDVISLLAEKCCENSTILPNITQNLLDMTSKS